MRLTTVILIASLMQASAVSFGQRITLNKTNTSFFSVLNDIRKQSGYDFYYDEKIIPRNQKVSVAVSNVTIEEALSKVLNGLRLTYKIEKNTVLIVEMKMSSSVAVLDIMPPSIVQGKVLNEKGEILTGVTVTLIPANKSQPSKTTASGNAGVFNVAADDKDILQFSFIGYKTKQYKVSDLVKPVVIRMESDISFLDAVQVVAYGTTTKRLTTSDQTSVSAKEIEKYPVNNVLEVLQGTVPGLSIAKNTGNANSTYRVQLRGINGIASSQPLYIVDGIPYQGGSYFTQNNTLGQASVAGLQSGGGDALSLINSQDIESITVLKDASATAIYGTRAADGVIIITTKKGRPGSPSIDVNFYQGYTKINHFPKLLNLQQYLQMRREAKKNDNSLISSTDYDINGVWDTTRNTNWAKTLLGGTGNLTNVQAGISGGSINSQYRISTGYSRQTSITDLSGSSQNANLNFSLNTQTENNKFTVQLTGGYFYNINTTTPSDLTNFLTLAPNAPAIYNPDGTLNFQNNTFINPYIYKNLVNNTGSSNLTSSMILSYRPLNGLEFKTTLGYNIQQINEFLGYPTTSEVPTSNAQPYSRFTDQTKYSWSVEPQVSYNRDISKGKLSIVLGSSLQKNLNEISSLRVSGYSSDLLLKSISAGTSITSASPYVFSPYKLNSLFGRVSYNWANKYLLDISGRDDGSSNFGQNRQFHLFGALGAGWIFTEESLIKDKLSFLSFGKLRGSYGVTGRDNISPYQYLSTYGSVSLPYQGVGALVPQGLSNPDLSWESTKKAEISLELNFLKDRIAFETNFYRNRTSDVLNRSPLSQVTGFSYIVRNLPATIQNQGFDISLKGYNIQNTNFSWSTTILFTRNINKLLSYPDLDKSTYVNRYVIGQPINIIRVYNFAGVNPQTGVYQFYSKTGVVVPTPAATDNTALINVNPDFYGSVQNSFSYKYFTLDFLFRFVKQTGLNAFGLQGATSVPGLSPNTNFTTIVLNRWQKADDITDIQRYGTNFSLLFPQINAVQSNHAYGDASYIRLQNVSLTYALPKAWQKSLHFQNLRVYIQGENLLTISRYGAFDPENQSLLALPPLRTITAGLKLSL